MVFFKIHLIETMFYQYLIMYLRNSVEGIYKYAIMTMSALKSVRYLVNIE